MPQEYRKTPHPCYDSAMTKDNERHTYGLVSVAVPAGRVTKPVFGRSGLANGALVVDWPAIVGTVIAAHTLPLRIKFPPKERSSGILVVKVSNSAFATEIAHLEPLILQKINGYFGYLAVARLSLKHGPLPARPSTPPPPPPAGPVSERLQASLAQVSDPGLKAALERLGRRIA